MCSRASLATASVQIYDTAGRVPSQAKRLLPDTLYAWELNAWYHTLNAGYRTRINDETDLPCIYGERVGLGRSYVRQRKSHDYRDWAEGIREGRNYVSDGARMADTRKVRADCERRIRRPPRDRGRRPNAP